MNIGKLIESMDRFQNVLPALVANVSDEDLRWKPESGDWSILEIVCHLRDEEFEDFRPRVKSTLEDPTRPWPPIDTEGVAIERKYNEQDLQSAMERFLSERKDSLVWLRSLQDPQWGNAYQHPEIGPIDAGTVMAGWAAHDQMHIRQIAKRLFQLNERDCGSFSTIYGGEWKA